MTLVALCSPAMGSGKSTLAAHLVDRHGFTKLAFAGALKAMTVALFGAAGMADNEIQRRVFGDLKEEAIPVFGCSSRVIQQTLGTEWGRQIIKPSIWVDITMAAAAAVIDQGGRVVIDDMRFPNELAAVKAAGGHPLRIVRAGVAITAAHASEGQLDDMTMDQLINDSTVENMLIEADRWIASL